MSGISIQKLYPDGTIERVAFNLASQEAEDVSSLTKIPAIHALLEMAYDGTLRDYGFFDLEGEEAVTAFLSRERDHLRTIAGESRNDAIYALAYKYGGPLADIESVLEEDGDVPLTQLVSMAHSDDPYGVTGLDAETARIGTVVARMNQIASNAGASNTFFVSPHGHTGGWDMNNWRILGWPEPDDLAGEAATSLTQHRSTADDLSLMTGRFLSEFPAAFHDIFSHRNGHHTMDGVLEARRGFATSEEGARWRPIGGKSGTGYGYWANGEPLEDANRHPRAGRFHGQTVYEEFTAAGESTGHYMVITVTGAGRGRFDRRTRDNLFRDLQRSVWTANGVPPIAEDLRERVSVLAQSVTIPELPQLPNLFAVPQNLFTQRYDYCDMLDPYATPNLPRNEHGLPPQPHRDPC